MEICGRYGENIYHLGAVPDFFALSSAPIERCRVTSRRAVAFSGFSGESDAKLAKMKLPEWRNRHGTWQIKPLLKQYVPSSKAYSSKSRLRSLLPHSTPQGLARSQITEPGFELLQRAYSSLNSSSQLLLTCRHLHNKLGQATSAEPLETTQIWQLPEFWPTQSEHFHKLDTHSME